MWPFKSKTISSDCCSGVLTCDGKHHTFTVWKDIRLTGTVWKPGMSEPLTYYSNGQERTCVICNYKERRTVGED
jgi:hypothetical protein